MAVKTAVVVRAAVQPGMQARADKGAAIKGMVGEMEGKGPLEDLAEWARAVLVAMGAVAKMVGGAMEGKVVLG